MHLNDFDYTLPDHLIARYPAAERTGSRLMVVEKALRRWQHRYFHEMTAFLKPGDLLVFNDTKVIPARLLGQKETGGKIELLIERTLGDHQCLTHIKASKSPKEGAVLKFESGIEAVVEGRKEALFILRFQQPLLQVLDKIGHMPLPPYIDRPDEQADQSRYQTIYAEKLGAVAAPTAGLHFDSALIQQLENQGVGTAFVTLHVGAGTFQPVRVDDVQEHRMHSEWFELPALACQKIREAKALGGRIIAVGTTSVRTLESAYQQAIQESIQESTHQPVSDVEPNKGASSAVALRPCLGETDIFIYPGYQFGVVDAMITNFHLPKSTLLMLISAFMGRELMLEAYQAAIDEQYRFFSYGDAMLLIPHS